MLRYTLKRLLAAIPTLFFLITLSFFLLQVAPGGPFDSERNLPPEIEAKMQAEFDLDKSLWQQYGYYLADLARGDFRSSFRYKDRTVTELIAAGFPVSFKLGVLSIFFATIFGTMAGCYAALRQNKVGDYSVMALAMTGISVPGFVVGPLLVLLFAVYLGWLPAGGWNNGALQNIILPVVVLALPQIAYIARMTRGSMIETLRSPFVLTARAKGLPQRTVVLRHALKPALLPVVSYLGPATAGIITGSVVVEKIFQLPGLGSFFVNGALNRDYTLVMGVVILYGTLIIVFNFLVDLLYAVLDPRVRQEYDS